MKQICGLFIAVGVAFISCGTVHAQTSREQLEQMVEQLQSSPSDDALREKIIALAVTVNPKPATPDAATMAEGAAVYAFTHAQSNSDYSDAAKQYEKALVLAPWLATDYFNCGVAHEKAGENKEAIRSFTLYLLAAPNATDAQAIKMRIGGLQYAVQKTVNTANDQVSAAAEQARASASAEAFYQGLDGGKWSLVTQNGGPPVRSEYVVGQYIVVKGHEIEFYFVAPDGRQVRSKKLTFSSRQFDNSDDLVVSHFTISADGETMTQAWYLRDLPSQTYVDIYRRE